MAFCLLGMLQKGCEFMILKKIKRILAFTLTLAMLLSLVPAVYAADTYEKATSIAVGDTVLLVYETAKKELSAISTTSTKYGIGEDYTDAPAGKFPLTVVEGYAESSVAFQTADGKYLYWTSGNSLNVNGTLNASTSWTVTFDADGNAVIKNAKDTSRIIYWNSSSPRFACYNKTGQQAVQLYKKVTDPSQPSCDHANAISEDTTPATCTEDGVRTYTCECGETWEETIPATGHDFGEGVETVAPGCETDGVLTKTCAICGDTVEEPIPATGHSYVDGICENCSEEEPDAPTGGYVLVKAGETLAVGDTIVIVCGSKSMEMKDFTKINYATGDTYTDVPMGLYPLVVLPGASEGTFAFMTNENKYLSGPSSVSSNNLVLSDAIDALSSWTVNIDANGDADIYVDYSGTARYIRWNASNPRFSTYKSGQTAVQIYKYVITEPTDPTVCVHESKTVTGHKDPSCVEVGYDEWTCNTCGETGTDVLFPSDDYHVPGEAEVIVLGPSSCYEEGLQEIVVRCTVCSRIISNTQETIPTTPHTYGEDDRCTVCSKYKAGKTFYLTNDPLSATYFVIYHPASGTALSLDASGKKLMPSQVTVENGVLTTVENTAVLLRIDSGNEAFPMSMATHDWSYLTSGETGNALFYAPEANEYSHWNPVLVSEADSTFRFMNAAAAYNGNNNQAIEFYKDLFTVYGVADTDAYAFQIYCDTKPACVHQWDEGEVTLEATCYAEGTLLRTCALCQEVIEEPIPMLGHAWEATEVVPPACYADGYTIYTCFGCGSERADDIIPATHGELVSEITPPTCDEQGYTTYTCSLCGFGFMDDFIDPTGHIWLEATCTSPSVCSVCGEEGGVFVPVTDINTIQDGDRIIFVVKVGDEHLAPTHSLNKNKLVPMMVGVYPNHLNAYDDSLVWEVVRTEGGIALYTDSGYLAHTAAKDTNFKYSEEAFTWELRSEETGLHLYSTLSDRAMMHRGEPYDGVFGVYAGSNLTNSEYSGNLLIYKYVPGQSTNHWDADSDNFCNGCGAMLKDAFLTSRSISLNGNIAVNFYMALSDKVLADKDAYMLFTQEGKDPVTVSIADCIARKVRNTDAYVFTYEVAAKEMTDIITAQFFYGDTSSEAYTYSVKTYADNQREALAENEALINLLDAMLRYGAASQIQFNYNTDRLADDGMEPVDYTDLQIEGYPTVLPQGTDLVTLAGASLLLKSETTLRFFLKVDASVENFTVTYNGQPLKATLRNGLYYVDVENIAAPNLDMDYTITVNDGTATADITYSPLAYCASVKANESGKHDAVLMNVVAALYLYNRAANTYFTPAE